MERKLAVRQRLQGAEYKRQEAEPKNTVTHSSAPQGLNTEVVDQGTNDYEKIRNILNGEANPIEVSSGVDIILTYCIYSTCEEIINQHNSRKVGRYHIYDPSANLEIFDPEDDVKESHPKRADQGGRLNAQEH
jgi:hypothetical protein